MAGRAYRNYVFRAHAWIGLHLSLFLAFLFLTGTFLVAGLELQLVGQPQVWNSSPASERTATFGQLYDAFNDEYPLAAVSVIERQPRPWLGSQIVARMPWKETVSFWADPIDGTLVGASSIKGLHDFLRELHDNLLLKKQPAFLLVTSMSFVLLGMIVTGLINYRRFWKGLFRLPPKQSTRRIWLGSVHRLAAVWAVPMLFIMALTSFVFFLDGLGVRGSEPKPARATERSAALPDGFDGATIDKAEAVARGALPGFQPRFVVLPGWPAGGIEFFGEHADALTSLGIYRVAVDPANFEVLGAFEPSDIRGIARIRPIVTMLHYGTWGHAFSRVLWILFGLAAFGIALTGVLIFAARRSPLPAQTTMRGSLRRVWRGLGIMRWVYLLLVIAIASAAFYTYSPAFTQQVRLLPTSPNKAVQLLAKRPLRAGEAYSLTMRVTDADVKTATLQLNTGAEQPVMLNAGDGARAGKVKIRPETGENTILLRLTGADGETRRLIYELGRPVW